MAELLTYIPSGVLNLKDFNDAIEYTCNSMKAIREDILDAGISLNEVVNFKKSRIDFYKNKISTLIRSLDESLTNRYQRTFTIPFNHMHYFDMAKSNAFVDVQTRNVKINETRYTQRIAIDKDSDTVKGINFFISNKADLEAGYVEYGADISSILTTYYNYFRYIARSRATTKFTFVVTIPISEQVITSARMTLDNITPFVDSVVIKYKNSTNAVTAHKTAYSALVQDYTEEFFIGDYVSELRVEITKNTHDSISFEDNNAFFDYYFTIKRLELFKKSYFHQNILYTRPISVGSPDIGTMRNSVRLRAEESIPGETDIKYFYSKSARGPLGNIIDTNPLNMTAAHNGDEIEIISHDKKVFTSAGLINRIYNSNYAMLDTPVNVTTILNGGISVFRGVGKYQSITTGDKTLYRFWLVYLDNTDIEIDASNYIDKMYMDTSLINTDSVSIKRGFYKLAVQIKELDDFTITDYVDYLKGLSSSLYIVRERLVFGLPSEVLNTKFSLAFTLLLRPDRKNADILVSMPDKSGLSEQHLVIYDKRK